MPRESCNTRPLQEVETAERTCSDRPTRYGLSLELYRQPSSHGNHHRSQQSFPASAGFDVHSSKCGFRTMPISVLRHADHRFRDDPDRLTTIVGTVIVMPGMVIAIPGMFSTGRGDAGHQDTTRPVGWKGTNGERNILTIIAALAKIAIRGAEYGPRPCVACR